MTPKQRMERKKELETQRKIQEAKNAAKDAHLNYQKAQEMKYSQLYASDKKGGGIDQTVVNNRIPVNVQPAV